MSKFIPEPLHDEGWWKSIDINNIIGFDNDMCDEEVEEKPGNWVAHASYVDEPYRPTIGYRVLFPTSTDCLYWIRWLLLLDTYDYDDDKPRSENTPTGKAKEIADIIDQSPDGTHSVDLLKKIREDVRDWMTDETKDVYFIGSAEEYKEWLMVD